MSRTSGLNDAEQPRPGLDLRRGLEVLKTPSGMVVLVALLYFAAQVVLFSEARSLEWDEAVYIRKANNYFVGEGWSAHRAFGVPWLLVPLFWVTKSFVAMRWYLAATSSVALALGFSTWTKPAGRVAPLALLYFSSSWLVLFYGSEASPNLYVAACAVGASGLLMQLRAVDDRSTILRLAGVLVIAAVFRPSDAVLIGSVLVLAGLIWRGATPWWKIASAIGLGGFVGLVPWLWDSFANFGGPVARWKTASGLIESSLHSQISAHLRLLDGPLIGPDRTTTIPTSFVAIVALTGTLSILAVILGPRRAEAALVGGFGSLLALPYLFYIGALAPRFLLPAQSLLSLSVAFGVIAVWRRTRVLGFLVITAVLGAGAIGVSHANTIEQQQVTQRSDADEIARRINEIAADSPCMIMTQYGYPQISIISGCRGTRLQIERAACQAAGSHALDATLVVSFIGEIPDGLEAGIVGDPLTGPNQWVTAHVDPDKVTCEE